MKELKQKYGSAGDKIDISERISKAYSDGYIAGAIANSIQWHDLRINPNDLPKFRHDILVTCEYKSKLKKKRETFEWDYDSDMPLHAIAWCEKPQFEE